MAKRDYTVEEVVLAHDILGFMEENKVSLEDAYDYVGVDNEMRLSEADIKNIKEAYFV